MRGLPRRNMFRLAQAIMIACVAALGTVLRTEGGSAPFYPPAYSAAAWRSSSQGAQLAVGFCCQVKFSGGSGVGVGVASGLSASGDGTGVGGGAME